VHTPPEGGAPDPGAKTNGFKPTRSTEISSSNAARTAGRQRRPAFRGRLRRSGRPVILVVLAEDLTLVPMCAPPNCGRETSEAYVRGLRGLTRPAERAREIIAAGGTVALPLLSPGISALTHDARSSVPADLLSRRPPHAVPHRSSTRFAHVQA
jgi:hypothetical protein